jgi:hypothetical protein
MLLLGLLLSLQAFGWPAPASANGDVGLPNFFDQASVDYFAPLLEMYHSEDNGPASGKWFLDRADLEFSQAPDCGYEQIWTGGWGDEAIAGLGHGGFRTRLKDGGGCEPNRRHTFDTSDYTRPYDEKRPAALGRQQGFYLDVCPADHKRPACNARWKEGLGDSVADDHTYQTIAPVYYDDGALTHPAGTPARAFITYWFFYAYNDGPRPVGLNHQGDWENMSYLFEDSGDGVNFQLKEISYAAHGAPEPIARAAAPRANWAGNNRYVGYVADGSHATYSSSGNHAIKTHGLPIAYDKTDAIGVGKAWPTWLGLRQLPGQGWAGYCGAWGSIANDSRAFASDRSGPLGPGCLDSAGHQRKTGRPPAWGVSSEPAAGDFLTPHSSHHGLDTGPVKPPNPHPSASDASFTFAVNGGPNAVTYHKALSASDDGSVSGWVLDWQDFGTDSQNFRWNANGSFDMKPEAPAGATLSFRFHVLDNEGAASNQATVTIHVCQNHTASSCPP